MCRECRYERPVSAFVYTPFLPKPQFYNRKHEMLAVVIPRTAGGREKPFRWPGLRTRARNRAACLFLVVSARLSDSTGR